MKLKKKDPWSGIDYAPINVTSNAVSVCLSLCPKYQIDGYMCFKIIISTSMLVSAKVGAQHARQRDRQYWESERTKEKRGDFTPHVSFCHKLPVFYYLKVILLVK